MSSFTTTLQSGRDLQLSQPGCVTTLHAIIVWGRVYMNMEEKASQISTAVFFIGLGLLFLTGWWWPGMMFVLAASMLARTIAAGESWQTATGAFWLLGIGIVFGIPGFIGDLAGTFWEVFPLILIGIGLFMLFGGRCRPKVFGKRKNDDDVHHV